jgi:hypothetical protein
MQEQKMRGLGRASWSGWLLLGASAALGCSGELASVADADSALTATKSFPACDNVAGAPSSFTSFQDGRTLDGSLYAGAADAWLDGATPTTNLGGDAECAIKGGGRPRSCLFRWDLSSIPSTSKVLGACLELTIDDPSVRSFDAFEVERAWTESGATWRNASESSSWGKPGARARTDRDRAVVASIPGKSVGAVTLPITPALVQKWVSEPEQNNGVVFANAAAFDGISLSSSDSSVVTDRPALRIYTTP